MTKKNETQPTDPQDGTSTSDPDSQVPGTTEERKPVKPPKGSKPAEAADVKEVLGQGGYGQVVAIEKGDGDKVHSVNVTVYPEDPRAEKTVAEGLLEDAGLWWAEIQMMGSTAIIRDVRAVPAKKDAGDSKEE